MKILRVMAGIVWRDSQLLLAQRPPGKELAGFWEFPGGKCEPGEDDFDALRRELDEELGIQVIAAEPLVSVPWVWPDRILHLGAWTVRSWHGAVQAREGQAIAWQSLADVDGASLAPADRVILAALPHPRA